MKFKLEGIGSNDEPIKLEKPIWFEFLVDNFGTNINIKFMFLQPVSKNIVQLKIAVNDGPFHIFYVDKIQLTVKNRKTMCILVASHPISLIWQNYVQPETFEKLTTQQLFEKFCQPFKIEKVDENLQNCAPDKFFTTLGMTYWDVISLFFKKNFNTTIFINKQKQITTKFKPANSIVFNTNNPNLIQYKNFTDRTKILSETMVQLPDDEPNKFQKLKNTNTLAEQLKINRVKFFKLPKQFLMLSHNGAKTIFDRQNANYKTVELKFSKILEPIYPGTIVDLDHNDEKISLCVNSFYSAMLKTGPVSKINFFYTNFLV